jgi:hypothetical protein
MNPDIPSHSHAVEALRDPDREERGDREVTYVWDLGPDPDGGTRQTVLTVSHHRQARGGAFSATVLNRTQDGPVTTMGDITTWLRLAAQPTARYSKRGLDTFAASALRQLQDEYQGEIDESRRLQGYFQAPS